MLFMTCWAWFSSKIDDTKESRGLTSRYLPYTKPFVKHIPADIKTFRYPYREHIEYSPKVFVICFNELCQCIKFRTR